MTTFANRRTFALTITLFTLLFLLIAAGLNLSRAGAGSHPTPIPPFVGETVVRQIDLPEHDPLPLQVAERLAAGESLTETFEAPLPPGSPWLTFDNDLGDGSVYEWGRENIGGSVGNGPTITRTGGTAHSGGMWAIGGGEDGGGLNPAVDTYPAGVDAWLVFGPLDLSGISGAQLGFDYWYDGSAGDAFAVLVSTSSGSSSQAFTGVSTVTAGTAQWTKSALNLDPYVGESTVYIAWNFTSAAAGGGKKGAFLDNVILSIDPPQLSFLPVQRKDPIPTPTPLPTPIVGYRDDFTTDISGWEDRERDLFESTKNIISHDAGAYLGVMVEESDDYVIVSPLVAGETRPYTIEARVRFVVPEDKDEFGIVFGADWNTSQLCPDPDQKFETCFNDYYLLNLRWRDGGSLSDALEARIVRVDNQESGNNHPIYTELRPAIRLDPDQVDPNDWNVFRIVVESDNDIKTFINGVENVALKTTDATYLGNRYFGVFVRSPEGDDFTKAQVDYFAVTKN